MNVTRLDDAKFRNTFVEPIERLANDVEPAVDFWPYFDAIPAADFDGHDCSAGEVDWVYRMAERYEHVMINSTTKNVFMAIVIDLADGAVIGHRLMNFNQIYGLETPSPE